MSKAQPYRVTTLVRSVLDVPLYGAMSSHRTIPDYFNHPALGIRPPSLLWLARVTGYLTSNHRRAALDSPKTKTPQNALVVLALGESNSKAIDPRPKPHLLSDKTATTFCGVSLGSLRLDATLDRTNHTKE